MSRFFAIVIGVACVVAACGGSGATRRVRKPGEEYLARIHIEGNTALADDALIPGLALQRAALGRRGIDEYQLGLDIERIKGAYVKLGYLAVEVEPSEEKKGDAIILTFNVKEGARATAHVEITGLPPEVDPAEARALVRIADGAPFDYGPYDGAKAPLLALLENAGYAHALVDASVIADRAKNHAVLRYAFDAGPRVQLGDIEIVGASGALADAIRRRATVKKGDPYSTKAIAATQQAIYGLNRFSSVRIDVDRTSLATVLPVKITVVEAKRSEARAGIGGGIDSLTAQARLRFSISHAGYPTPLTTVGAEFRPALTVLRDNCVWYEVLDCEIQPRIRLLGTATQQDLFYRDVKGDMEGGLDYLALEAYTMQGARMRLGVTLPFLSKRVQARVGWQLAGYSFDDRIVDKPTQERIGIDRFQRLGAFTQGISIDYRDDPVNTRKGGYAELRVAEGTIAAGGAFDYIQLTPDLRGYLPLGKQTVVAARARVGLIRGEVPPTERYFAGGGGSQRGFAERRLSPTALGTNEKDGSPILDADGNQTKVVIGGAASFETGLEVRSFFRPWGVKLGVVAFVDGGDVTEDPADLAVTNLHWAVGVGIRPYYLPVGPIRIEAAYRLNRTGSGEPAAGDRWNWLISVGEAF